MVADYNARSDMAHRAMFKCHLPYKVDERFAITGPPGDDAPEEPNDEYVEGADPNKEPPEAENCDGLPDEAEHMSSSSFSMQIEPAQQTTQTHAIAH